MEAETKSATIRHTKFSDNKKKNTRSVSLTKDIFTENKQSVRQIAYKENHSKVKKANSSTLNVSLSDKKNNIEVKETKEEIVGKVVAFSD